MWIIGKWFITVFQLREIMFHFFRFLYGYTGHSEDSLTLVERDNKWLIIYESNDEFNNYSEEAYSDYKAAQTAFYEGIDPAANPLPTFTIDQILKWPNVASDPGPGEGRTNTHKYYGLYAYVCWDTLIAEHAKDGKVLTWGLG